MKGKLISFEGGEGCGKSTQAKMLFEYLKSKNIPCLITREPGGTPSAEKIRNVLVTGDVDNLDKKSEVLLHYAARNEHLKSTILPALAAGKIVITDRFYDSTIAYQGYGHGVDMNLIKSVHDIIVGNFKPDITLVFNISPEKGLERSDTRHVNQNSNETRYEKLGLDFHKKVHAGFLAIASVEPSRCKIINADDTIDNIHQNLLKTLRESNIIS